MNLTIKTEWLEAAKTLENPFAFIEAIASYMQTGEVPALEPDAKGMFVIVKAEIDKKVKHRKETKAWREKSQSLPNHPNSSQTPNIQAHGSLQQLTVNHGESPCNTVNKKENPPAPPKEKTKKTETKVSAKESPLSFEQLIPASLKTVEFEIAWDQWCRYRKEKKQSITKSTAERQLKSLGRYPPAVAIAAIDQSITNGWIGLFPDKITIRLPAAKTRDYTKL